MTILQALNHYYDRLEGVAPPGWSPEKFGWCLVIDRDGNVVDLENLHDTTSKRPLPVLYVVPAAVKRTRGVLSNFLWDKTAYVLGWADNKNKGDKNKKTTQEPSKVVDLFTENTPEVENVEADKEGKRTDQEHEAFRELHLQCLAHQMDAGLVALRRFLERWQPEQLKELPRYQKDMLDSNILFRLDGEQGFIHDRPAARALVEARRQASEADAAICLVTGQAGPVARLHPTIKGVEGAQSSGAALVSFNLDAFTSLGKEQGDNAPTSEFAAFRYGAALNQLLTRDGPNRIRRPIGDATVVFWADASAARAAQAADAWFCQSFDVTDAEQATQVANDLDAIAKGRTISDIHPDIEPGTRFYVLGLSPNAARLSVRFWLTGDFGDFARNLADHYWDTKIEPTPPGWVGAPSVNLLLARTTALQGKFDNIPHALAGEVMRAVLTGGFYPRSLLAAVLMRLRAGDNPGLGWHAAMLRAVLFRKQRERRKDRINPDIPEKGETPMALDREHHNIGYLLGRLFAVYELAQVAALGRGVKATMRDKYFASASATPASVFPLVIAHGQNHLAKARKTPKVAGWAYLIERELNAIMDIFEPGEPHTLPRALRLEDQAEFAIGYYHQRSARLKDDKGEDISLSDHDTASDEEGNDE